MPKPPQATCPWIDDLQRLARRHMKGADRKRALELCENLRGANLQLRLCYADELERRQRAEKEMARLRRSLSD
jgi:hypothetical protein